MTLNQYTKIDRIGEGAYGVVHKARDRETGNLVALKCIRLENDEEGVPCTAIREISLLKELRHPNLVRLYEVLHNERKLTLVFEYLDMDLRKYLDEQSASPVPTSTIKRMSRQLLEGIAYCHKRCVLHRDLKPQNLLINKAQDLRIGDFGLGRAYGIAAKKFTHEVVTLWYRAPDVLLGNGNYGPAVDMWSAGCIMLEMITGEPVFPGQNDADQLLRIFKFLGAPNDTLWPSMHEYANSERTLAKPEFRRNYAPECKRFYGSSKVRRIGADGIDLIQNLLLYEPYQRLTAEEALEHPYFTQTTD